MTEYRVTPEERGARLDRLLAARIPTVSRMYLRRALDEGGVTVNGEPRPAGWRVESGDAVRVDLPAGAVTAMTPEPIPLAVLYEDAHLIVVEKPSGMVVHPVGRYRSGTLLNALAHHLNVAGGADPPIRPGVAHRLDRATSGLLAVAKTQEALSALTVAFQRRRVRKRYLALVWGVPEPPRGSWEAPIGADPERTPRWGILESGRPAVTRFAVAERRAGRALLELEPVTGRTNQLRIHCAHFGHPIVGDGLFGRGEQPGPGRLFLHAHRLEFPHPAHGAPLEFLSPLPPELLRFLSDPD